MSRLFLLIFFFSTGIFGQENADLEKRTMALAAELRCLVCQNQTIADSNAPLALDLRNTIREQLKKGASERDVIEFMTARYGDFVLYNPPFKATTVLLWLGPFLILVLGLLFLFKKLKSRPKASEELTAEEHARAAELLGKE